MSEQDSAALERLHADFDAAGLMPLWTQREGLMPQLDVGEGDCIAVPSWCPHRIEARSGLDLFCFSDAPIYEALALTRTGGSA